MGVHKTADYARFAVARLGLFVFLGLLAADLGSETMKMVTYYPAPYGSYKKFMTSGLTVLAKRSDARVGIGTAAPVTKLDVNGMVRIGGDNLSSCYGKSGTLRWNTSTGHMQYCDGAAWQDFQDAGTAQQYISNYLTQTYQGRPVSISDVNGKACPAGATMIGKYYPASGGSCVSNAQWAISSPIGAVSVAHSVPSHCDPKCQSPNWCGTVCYGPSTYYTAEPCTPSVDYTAVRCVAQQ